MIVILIWDYIFKDVAGLEGQITPEDSRVFGKIRNIKNSWNRLYLPGHLYRFIPRIEEFVGTRLGSITGSTRDHIPSNNRLSSWLEHLLLSWVVSSTVLRNLNKLFPRNSKFADALRGPKIRRNACWKSKVSGFITVHWMQNWNIAPPGEILAMRLIRNHRFVSPWRFLRAMSFSLLFPLLHVKCNIFWTWSGI